MYFHYTFLLTGFFKNDFIPDSPESSAIIIPVEEPLWEERAYYLQKLYATSATFCFGFFRTGMEWENIELSYIRDSLSLYFFLPNYIKKAGAYLLAADLDAGRSKEVMTTIEQLLEAQGIAPLAKNYTVTNSRFSQLNKYYYYNADLIEAFNNEPSSINFSALFKKIVADNGANKQIVVTVKDEEDYKRKIGVINDFEQWVSNNEKAYVDLLSIFNKVNDEYLQLQIDNKKLKFRLDNHDDYIKALRKIAQWHVNEYHRIHYEKQMIMQQYGIAASDVNTGSSSSMLFASDEVLQKELEYLRENRDNIQNWYNKEYEALPTWYKRFGHIIKVLTGKRSFKSLYK